MFKTRQSAVRSQIAAAAALTVAALMASVTPSPAQHAGEGSTMAGGGHQGDMLPPPAGVMGAHMMPAGKAMIMYSPMWMHMEGNRIGTDRISPEQIVTTVPNRSGHMAGSAGMGAPPATMRVAPTFMDMRAQMIGAMYGITDSFSVMVMSAWVEKEMEMITFRGTSGATRLATSRGESEGLGDTTVAGLIRLYEAGGHHVHAILGVSLPTGDIEQSGSMIAPNGMLMSMRMSYGMQLGTGTYDLIPGLVYTGQRGQLGWGAAYRGRMALQSENDNGYRWGDQHEITAWISHAITTALSGSLRIAASTQDHIHGRDAMIAGPFQGTHPDLYGGERVELFAGLSAKAMVPGVGMARLGIEAGVPVYQNLNGPQLERDYSLTATAAVRF